MFEINYEDRRFKGGNDRPAFYEPRNALKLAYQCLETYRNNKYLNGSHRSKM